MAMITITIGVKPTIKIAKKCWYSIQIVIPSAIPNIIVIKCESCANLLNDLLICVFSNTYLLNKIKYYSFFGL